MMVRRLLGPVVLVVIGLGLLVPAGCSRSRELSTDEPTTTAPDSASRDPLDDAALASGAEGMAKLQELIDRLLASNNTCDILTQKDVQQNQLDPTLFTSAAARQVLAEGLVQVFDHLIQISPPQIRQPLQQQKDVFARVLDVVERYANNPSDPGATGAISDLVDDPGFLQAQQQISEFIQSNC